MVVGYTLLNTWKQIICMNMHTISLTFFLAYKMACVFFSEWKILTTLNSMQHWR